MELATLIDNHAGVKRASGPSPRRIFAARRSGYTQQQFKRWSSRISDLAATLMGPEALEFGIGCREKSHRPPHPGNRFRL
jgi:hypothetical protein